MTPIILIPDLLCSAEVFAPQIPVLRPHGPVTGASPLQGRTMAEMADAILAEAPPRFALAGLSMGGYIGFAGPGTRDQALLSANAQADTPEQARLRHAWIEPVRSGRFEAFAARRQRLVGVQGLD